LEKAMDVRANLETVRAFYAAGPAFDDSGRGGFASLEIIWHVPGENPVSGEYRGREQVFGEINRRMAPLTDWRIEVVDVMGNVDLVVATVHISGERLTRKIDMAGAHCFRLDDRARIVEALGFSADQEALDAFLS